MVFVLPDFGAGGAQRVALTLADALASEGYATAIVAMSGDGPLSATVPVDIPVLALGHRRLRRALPDMIRTVRGLRPSAVFSTLGYMNLGLLAFRARFPRATRFVVREANTPSAVLPRLTAPVMVKMAYRLLYRRADAVIAPSEGIARELIGDLRVPETRVHVVPNPVDEAWLRGTATPVRRQAGDGARFVAAGRLTHQKGFDRLLAMFAELPPSAHLALLGDGPDAAALQATAASAGIADRVLFAGYSAEPWATYAGADALLLPSRWEGMPNVALEALACGTPVIATPEAGGIGEVAAAAPPGAVTIAAAGPDYVAAMTAVTPAPTPTPRDSLLPRAFSRDAVTARVRALLVP